MKTNSYRLGLIGGLLACGIVLTGQTAQAVLTTNSWLLFSGKWENGANWSAGVPASSNAVNVISNGLSGTATIDTATVTQHVINGCMTISNLVVGGLGRTLFLNNANNTPGNIGLTILNTFTITSGGTLLITNSDMKVALVGGALSDDGSALLNTGTIIVTNGALYVGKAGVGSFAVSNGTLLAADVHVANDPGSVGTLTIGGGASTFLSLVAAISGATGTVWLTGGQLTVSNQSTALGDPGVGNMTVSNGTWAASIVSVRQGTLTITGGSHKLWELAIASGGSALTASVWLVGGNLAITNTTSAFPGATNDTLVGLNGVGQMTISNGTFFTRNLYVGTNTGSRGTFAVAGGTNTVTSGLHIDGTAGATGTVWMTGGQLTVTNGPTQVGFSGVGQMTVTDGTWLANSVGVGVNAGAQGMLTMAGGTNLLRGGALTVGDLPNATGTVWLTDGQLTTTNAPASSVGNQGIGGMTISNGTWLARDVRVANLAGARGTLTIAGGLSVITSNLILGTFDCAATGIVNVTDGSLIVTSNVGAAKLEVRSGTFTQSGGLLTVRNLVVTNACGRFLHTGGTLTITGLLILDPDMDADGDGIPNNYELFSPVLDQLNPNDAGEDPDGDGFTNLQEYLAGTDPTDSASAFRITAVAKESDNLRVTWMMGNGKTNALQVSAGDGSGNFVTNNFTDLFTVTNTVGSVTNYLDLGAATNTPARYYRVRLVP